MKVRARTVLNPNQILEGTIAKGVFAIYVSNWLKREHLDERRTHRNHHQRITPVRSSVSEYWVMVIFSRFNDPEWVECSGFEHQIQLISQWSWTAVNIKSSWFLNDPELEWTSNPAEFPILMSWSGHQIQTISQSSWSGIGQQFQKISQLSWTVSGHQIQTISRSS